MISSRTTSACPPAAAKCSGVCPSCGVCDEHTARAARVARLPPPLLALPLRRRRGERARHSRGHSQWRAGRFPTSSCNPLFPRDRPRLDGHLRDRHGRLPPSKTAPHSSILLDLLKIQIWPPWPGLTTYTYPYTPDSQTQPTRHSSTFKKNKARDRNRLVRKQWQCMGGVTLSASLSSRARVGASSCTK